MKFNRRFLNKVLTSKLINLTIINNYFFVLLGFLGGNLYGSFFFLSPVFIIFGIIFCLEIFSCIYYKTINLMSAKPLGIRKHILWDGQDREDKTPRGLAPNSGDPGPAQAGTESGKGIPPRGEEVQGEKDKGSSFRILKANQKLKKLKYLYLIKIGFIFGIFVDAFKVGS